MRYKHSLTVLSLVACIVTSHVAVSKQLTHSMIGSGSLDDPVVLKDGKTQSITNLSKGSSEYFIYRVTKDTIGGIELGTDYDSDTQMFIKQGAAPTATDYQCKPKVVVEQTEGLKYKSQTCSFSHMVKGDYWVLLESYSNIKKAAIGATSEDVSDNPFNQR
ncbi:MAG: hypothetical protein ACPGUD_07805 [Parashewanella sp.]